MVVTASEAISCSRQQMYKYFHFLPLHVCPLMGPDGACVALDTPELSLSLSLFLSLHVLQCCATSERSQGLQVHSSAGPRSLWEGAAC